MTPIEQGHADYDAAFAIGTLQPSITLWRVEQEHEEAHHHE